MIGIDGFHWVDRMENDYAFHNMYTTPLLLDPNFDYGSFYNNTSRGIMSMKSYKNDDKIDSSRIKIDDFKPMIMEKPSRFMNPTEEEKDVLSGQGLRKRPQKSRKITKPRYGYGPFVHSGEPGIPKHSRNKNKNISKHVQVSAHCMKHSDRF